MVGSNNTRFSVFLNCLFKHTDTWRWSGTCFVRSATGEPWELTRLNTEAALVALTSHIQALTQVSLHVIKCY